MLSIFLKSLMLVLLLASPLTFSAFSAKFDSRCVKALALTKDKLPTDVTDGKPLYDILDPESEFACESSDHSDILTIRIPIVVDETPQVIHAVVNVRSENVHSLITTCPETGRDSSKKER